MLIKGRGKKINLSVIVSICNTAVSQFIDSRGQYFSYSGQFHLSLAKTENNQQAEVTLISSRSPSTGLLSQRMRVWRLSMMEGEEGR